MTLTAEEAELRSSPGTGVLTLVCRNGQVEIGGAVRIEFIDTYEREIQLADQSRRSLRQGQRSRRCR